MNFLSLIREKAGFTNNEVKVVLFLSVTFLVGLAIKLTRAPGAPDALPRYDYTRLDSMFIAQSRAADSLSSRPAEQKVAAAREPKKPPAAGSINVNRATSQELQRLPGVGAAFADRIVLYRKEHGRFASVEDLLNVNGFGQKRLELIRRYVTVR